MKQSLPKKSAIQANEMVMNSLPIPTMSDASAASVLHDGTYGASADGSGEPNVVNYNRMMISLAKSQNTRHCNFVIGLKSCQKKVLISNNCVLFKFSISCFNSCLLIKLIVLL